MRSWCLAHATDTKRTGFRHCVSLEIGLATCLCTATHPQLQCMITPAGASFQPAVAADPPQPAALRLFQPLVGAVFALLRVPLPAFFSPRS
eukprot:5092406-Amphidinium_carterae.1